MSSEGRHILARLKHQNKEYNIEMIEIKTNNKTLNTNKRLPRISNPICIEYK